MKVIILISFAFMLFSPATAHACSCGMSHAWSKPIKVKLDCSFENAGRGFFGHASGGGVTNIGGGRIGQKLLAGSDCCIRDEILLFADCNTAETTSIGGVEGPFVGEVHYAGTAVAKISRLQPPKGPIALTSRTTVASVNQLATQHDLRLFSDVRVLWRRGENDFGLFKRFNPMCGCKLYYPDSAGAKS